MFMVIKNIDIPTISNEKFQKCEKLISFVSIQDRLQSQQDH